MSKIDPEALSVDDCRELAPFARLLERRATLPYEPLELAYAEVYGEAVYEASEVKDE